MKLKKKKKKHTKHFFVTLAQRYMWLYSNISWITQIRYMIEKNYCRSWGTHLMTDTIEFKVPGSKSRGEWAALDLNVHEVQCEVFRRETLEQQLIFLIFNYFY